MPKKNRETYQSLLQKMTNACLELRNTLKAYGSDGESALIKALDLEFPFAFGFLCLPHIVRNIEHKIKFDLHLSDSFYRTVAIDFLLINSKRDWSTVTAVLILT